MVFLNSATPLAVCQQETKGLALAKRRALT